MKKLLFITAGLALLWWHSTGKFSASEPDQPANPRAAAALPAPREVKGYGQTVDDAKRDAYRTAVDKVTHFLQTQNPPLTAWEPDEAYVRRHLLDGPGRPGEDVRLRDEVNGKDDEQVPNIVGKVWILSYKETGWSSMLRTARSREHGLLGGLVLLGACAFLVAGLGYTRLVDWMHERYTNWMLVAGLAAAVILVLASVGLLVID